MDESSTTHTLNESYIHPDAWTVPFNLISQVACHNCYEDYLLETDDGEPLNFSQSLNFIKTVELDIWDNYYPVPHSGSEPGYWYVRHGVPGWRGGFTGNHNNCTPPGSLEECLGDVNSWSDMNPQHFPITVFIDKKQNWSTKEEGRSPSDLFNLLEKIFGDKLYTPQDQVKFNQANAYTPAQWKWPTAAATGTGTGREYYRCY